MFKGGLLEDILTVSDREKARSVVAAPDDNFIKLVDALGLDRRRDLRHVDLSGVDFSDCDLRGCDFTGSDLRGAMGSNVVWDETTVLSGANVDRSLFSQALTKRDIALRFPELGREYVRLVKSYWTDQTLWVMDALAEKRKNQAERQALAMALYFEAKDGIVRKTILEFLVFGKGDRNARIDFLAHLINLPAQPVDATVSSVAMLGQLLKSDPDGALMLVGIAESQHRPARVRAAALRALLQNDHVLKHNRRAFRLVQEVKDRDFENLYIRAFARHLSVDHLAVASGGLPFGGLNFQEFVTSGMVSDFAKRIWRARENEIRSTGHARTFRETAHAHEVIARVFQIIVDLVERGVDLKLVPDLAEAVEMERVLHIQLEQA
jgi:hypothetical protein